MTTQLTDLMQRATENLEPVTRDLLERSVQQGLRQRRRRTTVLGLSGAGAVLATAGLIAGGIQWLGNPSDAAVAGTPALSATANPTSAKPAQVDPNQTLKTLRLLLDAPGRAVTKPETWGSAKDGFTAAAYVVDDGKGAARVDVLLSGGGEENPCATSSTGCTKYPDGSVVFTVTEQPEYSGNRNKDGVVSNYVALFLRDGRLISLTSYNAPTEKGSAHTRQKPLLSVPELIKLAQSKAWKVPPVTPAKPSNKVAVKPSSKVHPTK